MLDVKVGSWLTGRVEAGYVAKGDQACLDQLGPNNIVHERSCFMQQRSYETACSSSPFGTLHCTATSGAYKVYLKRKGHFLGVSYESSHAAWLVFKSLFAVPEARLGNSYIQAGLKDCTTSAPPEAGVTGSHKHARTASV